MRGGAPDCLSITANANSRERACHPANPEDRVSGDARCENYRGFTLPSLPLFHANQRALCTRRWSPPGALYTFLKQFRARRLLPRSRSLNVERPACPR